MEEIRNVITHSSTASSSSPTPSAQGSRSHTRQAKEKDTSQGFQQKSADDSLIQVIEKLSKIVEKRPQRRCTSGGQKRGHQVGERGAEQGSRGSSDCKKSKRNYKEEVGLEMTCYQCSLCPYLSQTLPLLKEHLKQHNEQHSDLILMCSECHFTSTDHEQLEAHVRMHFDNVDDLKRNYPVSEAKGEVLKKQDVDQTGDLCSAGTEGKKSPVSSSKELPQKKKWYSYEEYGLYRCLICSYVCSQQRMLKTHAWKHAGLVDCSYPIFEDEDGGSAKREVQGASSKSATREEVVVLQDKSLQKLPTAFKLQLCMPVAVEDKQEVLNLQVSNLSESPKTEEDEYPIKDLTSEEPMVEVQVTTEAETEVEIDGHHESSSVTDSLLSSAQKIINSSPNSAGHINVIVERLPSAEDSVMASNPLLLSPDVDGDKNLLEEKTEERDHVEGVKDEVVLCYSPGNTNGAVTKSSDSSRDENVPPAGRKRTHSESLRLHSLAAEALVAMPMRTPELPHSGAKASTKNVPAQAQSPQAGPKPTEVAAAGQKASDVGTAASLVNYGEGREGDLGSLGLGKGDEEGPAANVGISLSLLTVIERLRERSDQNASDEDILKELQDNAQFQNGAGVVAGNGAGSYVLVDYIPGSERPYRCRLCRYSSGNKGYIKQHLRVHRQRQPYQCPICEHIALDSKDLENHMIHHCKSRMYQCKQCPDAFHYKSQLRTHEREHHSITDSSVSFSESCKSPFALPSVTESLQKMYKCDVCSYTSSTYVGVRNHRRIHNSDKPYRCSLCGYVCSHPPSLKSHMWKHAGDQNYNYEQVNKAINEAISQSSRLSAESPAGLSTPPTDPTKWSPESLSPPGKDPAQLQSQSHPRTGQLPAPGPGMEYCVLLFCCCICGFESTSKERLMEHMKEHEGDIISIILNKEQQQPEAQTSLQTAE
uniref:Zinc finger protein 507 n=1 Tax=Amphilophus citrinellus TaxID=61819 RepID=A0A3Q0RMX5_AMPCI